MGPFVLLFILGPLLIRAALVVGYWGIFLFFPGIIAHLIGAPTGWGTAASLLWIGYLIFRLIRKLVTRVIDFFRDTAPRRTASAQHESHSYQIGVIGEREYRPRVFPDPYAPRG